MGRFDPQFDAGSGPLSPLRDPQVGESQQWPESLRRVGRAFANRRFRTLLLTVSVVPITVQAITGLLIVPLVTAGHDPTDFTDVYLKSASTLLQGGDPYRACSGGGCFFLLSHAGSFYPPAVSWAFQPLARLPLASAQVLGILIANSCVVGFLICMVRVLRVRDWQLVALMLVMALSWSPLLMDVVEQQLQTLILLLSGLWLIAYTRPRGDRFSWIGGAALGIGIALKLQQAPSLALTAVRGRFKMAAAGAGVWATLWILGAPNLLAEYLFRVVPQLTVGTGFPANESPAGTIDRILEPATYYGHAPTAMPIVRVLAIAVSLLLVLICARELRFSVRSREGRLLEGATVIALTPLLTTLTWPGHLVLLLIPIFVIGIVSLRRRDWTGAVLALASWLLIGPLWEGFVYLKNLPPIGASGWLRPLAEISLAGQLLLLLSGFRARRRMMARDQVEAHAEPSRAAA